MREGLCDNIFFIGNEDMNFMNIWNNNILGRGNHEYNSGRSMLALSAQQRPACLDGVSGMSGVVAGAQR